jgi:hypothetical protein
MKRVLPFVPSFFLALALAQAQDVTGDWLGTVNMPSGDSRLALHISKAERGLKATLDSVDHGVHGVPIDSIQLADSKLAFNISALQVSFDGQVDATAAAIEGAITSAQGSAAIIFRRGTIAKVEHKPAKPSDIDGDWSGTLNAGGEEQKYLFHITNTEDGLVITMDLPAQYVKGAAASSVTRHDSSIAMEWRVFGSRLDAKIAEDRNVIEGTVTQAGNSVPITLKRVKP